MTDIKDDVEQVFDLKHMVVTAMVANKDLLNQVFMECGASVGASHVPPVQPDSARNCRAPSGDVVKQRAPLFAIIARPTPKQ